MAQATSGGVADRLISRLIPLESPTATTTSQVGTRLRIDEVTFESSIFKGDWERAKEFIRQNPILLTTPISVLARIALHVAACEARWKLVEELAGLMPEDDLGLQDALGCTALHYAAVGGSIKACKALVMKNQSLTQTVSSNGWTPLLSAVHCSPTNKDTVYFLSSVTTDAIPGKPFTGPLAGTLAYARAGGGFHDILLYLIESYPALATAKDDCGCGILDALVLRPQDFPSGTLLGPWQHLIYKCVPKKFENRVQFSARYNAVHFPKSSIIYQAPGIKQVYDAKFIHTFAIKLINRIAKALSTLSDAEIYAFFLESNIIVTATSSGIVEIVKICLQMVPDKIRVSNYQQTLLKIAVQQRQEKLLDLMHNMFVCDKFTSFTRIDESDDSILHLAARLAPDSCLRGVHGAALQMQKEIEWFKKVEKLVHPFHKDKPNSEGKTAQAIFTKEHENLLEKAQKWMKNTSSSCMVVTALVATVLFAAIFTVPGGNDQENGIPLLLSDKKFDWFAISDASGLFFSSISLLTFLSIQTAPYAEEDFLETLPREINSRCFFSLFSYRIQMITIFSTFSLAFHEKSEGVAGAICLLALGPVTLYAILHLPLVFQVYFSTYGRRIFHGWI